MNWPFVIRQSGLILNLIFLGLLTISLGKIILFTSFLTHLFIDHDLAQHGGPMLAAFYLTWAVCIIIGLLITFLRENPQWLKNKYLMTSKRLRTTFKRQNRP